MKDLVEFIAKRLVSSPENVGVEEVAGEHTSILELRVHQDDLGKIIGKQGRTARALRTVLNVAGIRLNRRILLEILD